MNPVLLVLLGAAIGAAVAWALQRRRRAELERRQNEAEGRARGAESALQEVRTQLNAVSALLTARQEELARREQELREEAQQKVRAQTELAGARRAMEEERKLLDEAKRNLTETFQALSAEALKSNSQAFITLARSQFETLQAQARGELETRQKAIEGVVGPLKESLGRYESELAEMERARQKTYGALDEQLRALALANRRLEEETRHLANALSSPLKARGRWGELTLRRVVELAGMSEHCDFIEQETVSTESGRQRPDMTINLPGHRRIAVDAKVPLQSFLDAVDPEKSEEERSKALAAHGKLVRNHMYELAERKYWEEVGSGLDLVVLFLPGESFFSAAVEQDRELIDDGMRHRVVLATPTTLIALLRSAAWLWQQEMITENAKRISELGRELHERFRTFLEHFERVGNSLGKAVDSYNQAVASLESRLLVSARKFKELGAAGGEGLPVVERIDESPRALAAPEVEQST